MRVFAVSDVHLEHDENRRWLSELSHWDYRDDILILAGDVSVEIDLLVLGLRSLTRCFGRVLYVPGNHELWLTDDCGLATSLDKFSRVCAVAADCGVSMAPLHDEMLSIVPLLSWYDFTFGRPAADLQTRWMDFRECRWPAGLGPDEIATHFLALNEASLAPRTGTVISFSHFVPRVDLLSHDSSALQRLLLPVLGTTRLEAQIRQLRPAIHIYGHSHVNREVTLNGTVYINNAFGYPGEEAIATKRLRCVSEH